MIHVLPQNDLFPHEESEECWCEPETIWTDGGKPLGEAIVIHNAADGRELTEN